MARDYSDIVRLYVEELRSYESIGREYGVTAQTIMRWLRAAGVKGRTPREARKVADYHWVPTEEQKASRRKNLVRARAAITEEGRRKHAAAMRGREPPNKGKPWSDDTRAKHSYRQSPEHRRKLSEANSGARNHAWKGGSSDESRMRGWEWRQRRQECYERDRFHCRDCGVKCHNGVRIQAHHVIPRRYGGGDELENLLTLCAACHRKRERKYAGAMIA